MGKNGKALRELKKQNTKYVFTAEQLAERDKAVIAEYKSRVMKEIEPTVKEVVHLEKEQAKKVIQDEWDKRAEEFSNAEGDNYFSLLQYLLAVPARVLIEKFGWQPIPKEYTRRNRLMKFADYMADEISMISGDEMMDIREYCKETYKLYGVRFETREYEDN